MQEIGENAVYTSKEVESLLKISSSTLKRLIKKGLIKANKIGGQYRFLGSELLRLLSPTASSHAKVVYKKVKQRAKEVTKTW